MIFYDNIGPQHAVAKVFENDLHQILSNDTDQIFLIIFQNTRPLLSLQKMNVLCQIFLSTDPKHDWLLTRMSFNHGQLLV